MREEQPPPPPMRDPGANSIEGKSSEEINRNSPMEPMESNNPPMEGGNTPDPDPLGIYKGYEYTTPYPTEGYYYYTTTPWYVL